MDVINNILQRLDDDKHLHIQMENDPALEHLVRNYNQLALRSNYSYTATGETYGLELKKYLAFLPASDILRLLNVYVQQSSLIRPMTYAPEPVPEVHYKPAPHHHPEPKEDEEEEKEKEKEVVKEVETVAAAEERRFKFEVAKILIIGTLIMVGIIVGVTLTMMVHNKVLDSTLIKTLMETITEVLKVLNSK